MNREDIIRMAREAGIHFQGTEPDLVTTTDLKRFAALVASSERESLRESFRVVTAAEASAAILHEREACAKVCDEFNFGQAPMMIQKAIRARGQT